VGDSLISRTCPFTIPSPPRMPSPLLSRRSSGLSLPDFSLFWIHSEPISDFLPFQEQPIFPTLPGFPVKSKPNFSQDSKAQTSSVNLCLFSHSIPTSGHPRRRAFLPDGVRFAIRLASQSGISLPVFVVDCAPEFRSATEWRFRAIWI
jgi:hypothetical protein